MNKAEREQLKHNEAADALLAASSFASQHGRTLALALVGVILLGGTVLGYRAFKARTEERAAVQLASAVEILNAPVNPLTVPPASGGATPAPVQLCAPFRAPALPRSRDLARSRDPRR